MTFKVEVIYCGSLGFSGQTTAIAKIKEVIDHSPMDININQTEFPAIDRSNRITAFKSLIKILVLWVKIFKSVTSTTNIYCFGHGQSFFSLIRLGIPHLIIHYFKKSSYKITTLHGNEFLNWSNQSLLFRTFKFFLLKSNFIVVTGPTVRRAIIEMGIPSSAVKVINNPCEVNYIPNKEFAQKWKHTTPLKILHLSLLIESKGFPLYLKALQKFAQDVKVPVEATLCGPLVSTKFCTQFKDERDKEDWIKRTIKDINKSSPNLKVSWINGAKGAAKEKLFKEAHIFVFPSTFPVESQPLVLIEAMASGCAIISSKVGEITSFLNPHNAILLDNVNVESISTKLKELTIQPDKAKLLAQKSLDESTTKFSLDNYRTNWLNVIKQAEVK
ncbi:glycosyltransferase family 4 protein [Marinoscillum furvescens]|uniref:Glycosyl transferase family 1 domain-containing protein n=1 Tax=Marinoscillum furvescens DSM 4134 TaxID=1122208 RepID=A0A3D9KZR9_MARFU|nr:glycosyltransferase family 4 protein [Marinoscillum furvescens]RED96148.1 hypothetical protein C7460_11537 [Marinoscillum furvescens DSM 4134]